MNRTLVVAAALAACSTPSPRAGGVPPPAPDPAHAPHGVQAADLDRRVDPCTDFFEFSSGGWRAANPIPAAAPRWSRRLAAREANRARLQALLEELSLRSDWPAGSAEQLAGDLYASCTDAAGVEAAGLSPLAPLLADIDAGRTPADVQRSIRRLHELAIPAAFGATGGMDYHEPTTIVLGIAAGRLGLADRDRYLKSEPQFVEARERYAAHLARLLELAGWSGARARQGAQEVVALETRLAAAALNPASAGNPARTNHEMTFAGLRELAPGFDWTTYFDEARLPRTKLNVAEPEYLRALDRELRETPVSAWKAYLTAQLLEVASPWLSRPFAEEASGGAPPGPRARRCADLTEELFPDPVGKRYAERFFPPAHKARVQGLVRNLMAVLREEAGRADWMTPATRQKALDKLAAYHPQVGYPDRWKDGSRVSILRSTLWANVAAARRFAVDDNRGQVGKPSDPGLWQLPASSTSAYLDLQLNSIVLPAAFLQATGFDPDATDAVLYGAIGAAIAHDMTHAIDTLGAENDVLGRPVNWWTEADTRAWARRGQCLVDQFEGYFIEPGVHHDGKLVLRESAGDLAGVRLAHLALQRSMTSRPVPTVGGFTPEQQFFIAAGQARAESIRIETQRQMVKEDSHPVSRFRVIGPLSNLPEFQRAFSCKAAAEMVRPPEKRCAVW